MTRVRYRILGLLFGVSIVNYLLRNNLSVALPGIRTEFGFSNEQLGWILAGFNVAYTIAQIPGGAFGDRTGPRRAFAVLATGWAIATLLTGWLPTVLATVTGGALAGLVIARAVTGLTHAPMFPVSSATIANWFPRGRWALPNALLSAGLNIGQALTGPVVGTLVVWLGWRGSFYALAPLGFIVALLWWRDARDTPAEHPRTDAAERALVEKSTGTVHVASEPGLPALRNPQVLILAGSYLCMNIVFLMFSQWLFTYLVEERGFTMLEGGALYALPFIVGMVFAVAGGALCDTLCHRLGPTLGHRIPAVVGLLLVAVLLLAGSRAPDPYVAVALLALCFGFTQFTEGGYWSATTHAAHPHTAVATGVLNTGGNIAGFFAPVIGWMIDHTGWNSAFAVGSGFAIVAALLWLLVRLPEAARAPGTIPR